MEKLQNLKNLLGYYKLKAENELPLHEIEECYHFLYRILPNYNLNEYKDKADSNLDTYIFRSAPEIDHFLYLVKDIIELLEFWIKEIEGENNAVK